MMTNMSYCRFQNTLSDLWDCYENMDNCSDSEEELSAKEQLIKLCEKISEQNK